MTVFIILVVLFGLLHLPGLRTARPFRETVDKLSWALGVTLLVTASSHFLAPETLVAMMPLLKVTDMTYDRSLLGRIVGYGTFVLESVRLGLD